MSMPERPRSLGCASAGSADAGRLRRPGGCRDLAPDADGAREFEPVADGLYVVVAQHLRVQPVSTDLKLDVLLAYPISTLTPKRSGGRMRRAWSVRGPSEHGPPRSAAVSAALHFRR